MNFTNMMMFFEGEATGNPMGSPIGLLVTIGMMVLVFWLFIYRPQKKQEKETADMRDSIERGDVIVTTGGIVGMVVKIKDDMLLIETGGDRTKIQIKKWAVHAIVEKANAPEVVEEPKKK